MKIILKKSFVPLAAAMASRFCLAGLPSGYQAVDYIEATGAQSIDCGFTPMVGGGTGADIEFVITGGGTARANIFACGWCDFSNFMILSQQGTVAFGGGTTICSYDTALNSRIRLDWKCNGDYAITINGEKTSTGNSNTRNNKGNPLQLFSCGNEYYAYCRFYGASFATNDIPTREFVPCYRASDSKPGLYDLVEGVFYVNRKSGADFLLGADRCLKDDLKVSGDPVECGVPTIAYGMHAGYKVGDAVSVSIDRVAENADRTIQGTCTGYAVLTNGVVYASGSAGLGSTVTASFTFPECDHGAEVVFYWNSSCKISAEPANADYGTVSPSCEWCKPGDSFTVTATPRAGYAFYRWMGSDGREYGRDPVLTITVADTLTLTAEFGEVRNMAASGGDDTTTILDAIDAALVGSEIHFAAGTYNLTATIVLDKDIRLIGADRETTVLKGNDKQRLVKIEGTNAPFASVENLKLTHGYDATGWGGNGGEGMTKTQGGGAVFLCGGGTVRNCIVEDCSGRHNGGAHGIHAVGGVVTNTIIRNLTSSDNIIWGHALIAEGGALVTHSVVSNCVNTSLGGGVSSAPVEAGGEGTVIRNCLIADCCYAYASGGSAATGMGIHFRTAGALVESTSITGNRINSANGYAVYGRAAGGLLNCIVADNKNNIDAKAPTEADIGGTVSATNTAARPQPSGEGNVLAPDPVFKSGTFELVPGSALIGSGSVQDWMTGAVDLKGIPRLREGAVDMGAFCYVPPTLACSIASASAREVRDQISATITSTVEGETAGLVYHWDLDGDLDYDDVEDADKSSVVLETSETGVYPVRLKVTNGTGDEATSEPLTFTVVPSTLYVNASCAEPIAPYGDPDHAANSVADAVGEAMAGCTVEVAPGTYVLDETLSVNRAITIRSSGTRDDTVLCVTGKYQGVALNVSGIVFSGLTVTNGFLTQETWNSNSKRGGGNLYASEGTAVERCRFTGARCDSWTEVGGVSLGIYNATVRDCEIVHNHPNPTGGWWGQGWQLFYGVIKMSGTDSLMERCLVGDNSQVKAQHGDNFRRAAGLQLEGGVARCCLFRGNYMTEGTNDGFSYRRGAAVFAKDGVLENCTVVGNYTQEVDGNRCPAVWAQDKAVVRNCIIWDNAATSDGLPTGEFESVANWDGVTNATTFTYCCTLPALADGHSVSEDPLFANAAARDGLLRAKSPCSRKGLFDADWMTTARDFYGSPLSVGSRHTRVDIGCCVAPPPGLALIVK